MGFNAASASPVASLPKTAVKKGAVEVACSCQCPVCCLCMHRYTGLSNTASIMNPGLLHDIITKQITFRTALAVWVIVLRKSNAERDFFSRSS